jgi:uncharacterized ion transporter superfamily protein YfcC
VSLLKRLKKLLGIFIAIIFVISFIIPPGVFAQIQQNEDMEKKCKATREGTETDQETKKACAGYFEQTGAAGAAGASAGAAASTGMGAGTIAAIVVGVAAAGAVVAAAAGGGGGGGSTAPAHHSPAR